MFYGRYSALTSRIFPNRNKVNELVVNFFYILGCRSYASGISGVFSSINIFGSTKLFPHFVDIFGFSGTFWMFSCVMSIEVIYAALSIPENRGESLVRTEDKMINNKEDNKNSKDYKETETSSL